jgi:hypothetical protein
LFFDYSSGSFQGVPHDEGTSQQINESGAYDGRGEGRYRAEHFFSE